jgi:hypothetical protein
MEEPNLFQIFLSRLNKIDIRYMITGAVAVIIYGEPRLTQDIDLVIELKANNIETFRESFPPEEFYCPPAESLKVEMNRPLRGHFNIIHLQTGFKADCYMMGEDPLHRWGMSKRRKLDFEGESIWVAPPEYVILRKLEYYRDGRSEKHLRDIASVLSISGDRIDLDQLLGKIEKYGLQREWKEAQKISKDEQ